MKIVIDRKPFVPGHMDGYECCINKQDERILLLGEIDMSNVQLKKPSQIIKSDIPLDAKIWEIFKQNPKLIPDSWKSWDSWGGRPDNSSREFGYVPYQPYIVFLGTQIGLKKCGGCASYKMLQWEKPDRPFTGFWRGNCVSMNTYLHGTSLCPVITS